MERASPRTLALWAVAGVAGLAVAFSLFFVAFPEASIDFKVTPSEATAIGRDFLRAQGIDVAGYTSTVVLKPDNDAKIFLEREVGLERANVLMANSVSVFAFDVRFFRDLQREELAVQVDPGGRVVGMRHVVEEERAGPRLDAAAARGAAEVLLRRIEPRFDAYRFLAQEQTSIERPGRRDWTFTWERTDLGTADAPYRLTASVLGGSIGDVHQGLKVPERWKRDFDRLRSENTLYAVVDAVALVLLLVAVAVAVVRLVRRGAVRWRMAAWLGAALAAVFVAMGLNALPLALATYPTTTSFPGFVVTQVVGAVAGGVAAAALVALVFAAAEPAYRDRWPGRLRLALAWRPRALGTNEVFGALVIGLSLAGASLGGQVLFYVLGRGVGVWAPQDVRYADAVGTALPWLFPLGIGVQAATLEEFLFRLFAIPLLLAWTRSRWIAVLIPALVWGFGHSTYPVEPGYVRGIEVGIIGIVTGIVFLRFGILPTLVWHYTFDAGLIGLLLVRSSNAYFQISGAVVGLALVVPLIASAALLVRRRGARVDPSLLNAADPLAPAAPAPVAAAAVHVYRPAPERLLRAALVVGVTGLFVFIVVRPPETVGSFLKVPITAHDATRIADDQLRALSVDPSRYLSTATLGGIPAPRAPGATGETTHPAFDPYVNEYLREQVGVAGAERLYATDVATVVWRVRYVRDSAKEEYAVLLRPDGGAYALQHRVDEAAPGADLSRDDARAAAERYARERQGLDLRPWTLVDASSRKLPQRTDHTLVWERPDAIGDAHVRAEIALTGAEITGFRTFVKIPEEWERRQKQQTLLQTLYGIVRALIIAAAAVAAVVVFFRNIRRGRVPWRVMGAVAAGTGLAFVISSAVHVPQTVARYTTEIPLATFLGVAGAGELIGAVVLGGLALLLEAAAWLFCGLAFGEEQLPSRHVPAAYWRDAAVLGASGAGAYLLLGRVGALVDVVVPVERRSLPVSSPSDLDLVIPALGPLSSLPVAAVFVPAVVFATLALVARYVRAPALRALCVGLGAVTLVGDAGSATQLGRDLLLNAVLIGLVGLWMVRVVRSNVAALVVAVAAPTLVRAGLELVTQPNGFYVGNGIALFVAAGLIVALPFLAWRSSAPGHVAQHASAP